MCGKSPQSRVVTGFFWRIWIWSWWHDSLLFEMKQSNKRKRRSTNAESEVQLRANCSGTPCWANACLLFILRKLTIGDPAGLATFSGPSWNVFALHEVRSAGLFVARPVRFLSFLFTVLQTPGAVFQDLYKKH